MTEPKMHENIDELDFSEVTDNLLSWLKLDVKKRKEELEQAKKNLEFFQELLADAQNLADAEEPGDEHLRGARWRLELITKRRQLDKTVPDWSMLSAEERAEHVYRSDDEVTHKYFPDYNPKGS